jgi:hypothetical protein
MSQTQSASILDRLLEPLGDTMPVEYTRKLFELRAGPADQERIDDLADKCNEGLLTSEEREEYERYVQAIQVITVLQLKARRVLAEGTAMRNTSPSMGPSSAARHPLGGRLSSYWR